MKRRNVFSNIHHRLCRMLQHAEAVLDIAHDLPVILLVLLQKMGVLLHLIVHLAGKRLDLVLQGRVKIMEFLLELKEGLKRLIVRGVLFRKMLQEQKARDDRAKRYGYGNEDQQ